MFFLNWRKDKEKSVAREGMHFSRLQNKEKVRLKTDLLLTLPFNRQRLG
jgi:hypothetical protein